MVYPQADPTHASVSFPRLALRCLHVTGLTALGIAQPLLDVLGRSPEYFTVHRLTLPDILVLSAALLMLIPAPLLLLEWAIGWAPFKVARVAHGLVIALAIALVLLPTLASLSSPLVVGLALAGGGLVSLLYLHSAGVRSFFSVLAVAPVVVAVVFFSRLGSAGALDRYSGQAELARLSATARAPIVFLVFDEFAASVLLDENFDINPHRYPNLAALAARSTWFPNAATVAQDTLHALPAILTGSSPDAEKLPALRDYPRNLFTLLGGTYDVWADEPVTMLCPEDLNLRSWEPRGWPAFAEDLGLVYLHLVLPKSRRSRLPAVDENWGDFGTTSLPPPRPMRESREATKVALLVKVVSKHDRSGAVSQFLAAISQARERHLYFAHFLLPHTDWEFLPGGQRYTLGASKSGPGIVWSSNTEEIVQAYQRYVLQVGYVDWLVGEVVARLRDRGLFDRALIVIVGDHGESFRPGEPRRAVSKSKTNAHDIVPVPLLMKAPGQREGRRIERHVLATDVMPTLVDMLGVDSPWKFEGRSALEGESRPGPIKFMTHDGEVLDIASEVHENKREAIHWKYENFGSGEDPLDLFRTGPHRDLVGRRVEDLELEPARREAIVEGLDDLENTDPGAIVLPVFLRGEIDVEPPNAKCCWLAAVIDGKVVSLTMTQARRGPRRSFALLLPPSAVMGGGRFALLEIEEREGRQILRPLALSAKTP